MKEEDQEGSRSWKDERKTVKEGKEEREKNRRRRQEESLWGNKEVEEGDVLGLRKGV